MIFNLKKAAAHFDIPLAHIKMKEVKAADVIQIHDYSQEIAGNSSAAFRYLDTYPDGNNPISELKHKLLSDNIFGDILLTDEFYHDEMSGSRVPLWYSHNLKNIYYNSNAITRSVRKRVRIDRVQSDRIVTSLIPKQSENIIVTDSVKVYKKETSSSSEVKIKNDKFYIDYSVGTLIVSNDEMYSGPTPIYEFRVEYILVPLDIRIIDSINQVYRIELTKYNKSTSDFFNLRILSQTDEQMEVKYRTMIGSGTTSEIQEYTSVFPLYTEVTDDVRKEIISDAESDIILKRTYSIVRENDIDRIFVTSKNKEHLFSIKARHVSSSKIKINKPYTGDYISDWFLRISSGFIQNNSARYKIDRTKQTKFLREHCRIIDRRTVAVSGKNIVVSLTSKNTWEGIAIIKNSDGEKLNILSVDTKNGIIRLLSDISRRDKIIAEYSILNTDFEIKDCCINPLSHHKSHRDNLDEKSILVCIIEYERNPPERAHPLYFKIIDTFTAGRPATYSYDLINTWLNSNSKEVRNSFRRDMNLPADFYSDHLIRIEPLAIIQLANPLDSDAYKLSDVRVFGGGCNKKQHSFYDHSNYDGEGIDLESLLVYEIPEWVKNDIADRAKLWDPETIKSSDKELFAEEKAKMVIKEKVKKFSMIGTTQEIVIGRKKTYS